ncbi:PmoA family protein [Micromonospora sp. NPDC049679]|uniref:DUF6807 domain-containing protein n=1 Tax=Micromonospora sp. NPDC049679 TaxID=3155920 RepID=UPI0033CBA8D8
MGADDTEVRLWVGSETVAEYVVAPQIDPRYSPRPYLHPVRTLGGVPVTDALPEDHRWHLGVSVTMQDVSGTNLWGGRTYVRDAGYTWRDDHGRIEHDAWLSHTDDHFAERLRWCDPTGATLLTEERRIAARAIVGRDHTATGDAWLLDVAYTLTAPTGRDVALGSPATNGRPGGAGYGGFFWRVAPGTSETFTASADGEERVNGSTEPWVALVGRGVGGSPYTLVFSGLGDGDHWFVRTGIYPGVCVALAYDQPLVIAAGAAVRRRHTVLVADGALGRARVEGLLADSD